MSLQPSVAKLSYRRVAASDANARPMPGTVRSCARTGRGCAIGEHAGQTGCDNPTRPAIVKRVTAVTRRRIAAHAGSMGGLLAVGQ